MRFCNPPPRPAEGGEAQHQEEDEAEGDESPRLDSGQVARGGHKLEGLSR